jgi:hypothetical protein
MRGVDKNASAAAVRVMAPPWIAETFRPAAVDVRKSPARMSELLCMQSGRLWRSKTYRLV